MAATAEEATKTDTGGNEHEMQSSLESGAQGDEVRNPW